MTENDIIVQDKEYKSNITIRNSISIKNKLKNSKILFGNRPIFHITFQNNPNHIFINTISLKRIFSNGQLIKKYEYILFNENSEKNELLFLEIEEAKQKEKELNDETTEDEDESVATIKDDELNRKSIDSDKHIILDIRNKKENIFNPKFPLLTNKIKNTFSNIDSFPQKYVNLIVCYNKMTISLDSLKYFYLMIFFCGLFNILFFMKDLFDKNQHLDNFYYLLYFPLEILFIFTGIYGYIKSKNNIYDNKICLKLTSLSIIFPLFVFILSRFYSVISLKANLIVIGIMNFISSFISFFSLIILKEVEIVKNSEKNILNS